MVVSDELRERIKAREFYSAKAIADSGFIKNTVGSAHDHKFVLRLVKRNLLKTNNMNPNAKRSVYQISANAIIEYLNGIN